MGDNYSLRIEGLEELRNDMARAPELIRSETRRAMSQSVNQVKNTAQDMAPYKTGNLKRSIFTDIQMDGFMGIVAQDSSIAKYGQYIEYGTAPHEILPITKKALFWKGALNPYRRVMHPGTSANPFMAPALESNIEKIKGYFEDAILKVVQTLARQ